MQSDSSHIANRIRALRMAKGLKQSELDERTGMPQNSTSKIERLRKEATASEVVRIAKTLGVTLDVLVNDEDTFVYQEEIKVVEALREIPFEDYKRVLSQVEAQVYFSAKDAGAERRKHLEGLVVALGQLGRADRRPRSSFAEKKRIRSNS